MLRRKRAEVHINQERWLVSYADFITLLFAFFVVMYSISQVNQSKYRVLSETFVQAFNTPGHFATDNTHEDLIVPVDSTVNPIQVGQPSRSTATTAIDVRSDQIGRNDSDARDEFAEISDLFSERFGDLISDQLVSVASNELWLQIELKDSILFASGSADPSLQAQAIFDEIALILKDYPNPVQVEGYTDNLPIKSARYPSNWELSTARASAVVKWLASKGVEPVRLSAAGFGEFQPIADNATAEGRAQNRRVVLMIARKAMPRPGMPLAAQLPADGAIGDTADDSASASAMEFSLIEEAAGTAAEASPPNLIEELSSSSATAAPVNPESEQSGRNLIPVELEDGGLLFTSDPDLPRNGAQ